MQNVFNSEEQRIMYLLNNRIPIVHINYENSRRIKDFYSQTDVFAQHDQTNQQHKDRVLVYIYRKYNIKQGFMVICIHTFNKLQTSFGIGFRRTGGFSGLSTKPMHSFTCTSYIALIRSAFFYDQIRIQTGSGPGF